MSDRESPRGGATPGTGQDGIVRWLRRWWRSGNSAEDYLAAASDLADLERRMRALERGNRGPAIVAFPAGAQNNYWRAPLD